MDDLDPALLIERLQLQPHPEGGWYVETWRDAPPGQQPRGSGSCIYYLLEAGQRSHWHAVDATEIWHYYAGFGLDLYTAANERDRVARHRLGPAVLAGERPQIVVPTGHWQSAEATRGWCLVGCTVSPAFEFSGFVMAEVGWEPGFG
ncbi:MAG: cupin domain-containing protein [Myxococcota bacterium]